MNRAQINHFLAQLGIDLYEDRRGHQRWATRPTTSSTPVIRFRTLQKANDFWMSQCLSRLYNIFEIEQSIRDAASIDSSVVEKTASWLDSSTQSSYPIELQQARSRIAEYTHPTGWRKMIIEEVKELGPIHDEWVMRRAAYYRALTRYGYHQDPIGTTRILGDDSRDC